MLELWGIGRGDDLRGSKGRPSLSEASDVCTVSMSKVFGHFGRVQVVGPDPVYKLHVLKDESKTNKDGTPELMGVTRRAHPSECAINAITTVFLLRFGKGGLIGELPDFFDPQNVTTVRRIA